MYLRRNRRRRGKWDREGREEIHWADMFTVLTLARFTKPSSELAIAESWYETALEDLLGITVDKVNDDRLYRGLDEILPHKDEVCKHLQERYTEWFGSKFDFLFYDVTSTYFEGECELNAQAKYGYSRDKRFDCKQVCIGLVVNLEGLPVGYEVFDGNRKDVTTLEEMAGKKRYRADRADCQVCVNFGFEFQRYLFGHPEIAEKIPKEAEVLFILKDDPEFSAYERHLAESLKKEGQSIIFVEIEKILPPFQSRLVNPHIELAPAS